MSLCDSTYLSATRVYITGREKKRKRRGTDGEKMRYCKCVRAY